MKRKTVIVADSSANLFQADCADFMPVPLKILTDEKEYVDNEALDVDAMLADLLEYKGRSSTACPSVGDWLHAFGDAEEVYGVSLTSHLSGCYNAACIAAEEYMAEHPGRKVFIQNCFPNADIKIGVNRGLCSYYAEKGGILVGFESKLE